MVSPYKEMKSPEKETYKSHSYMKNLGFKSTSALRFNALSTVPH